MRSKIMAGLTTAATGLGLVLTAGSSASAAQAQCTPLPTPVHEFVTSGSTNYYLAAPNNVASMSHPELKAFAGNNPNSTATFVRCNITGQNASALEYSHNGVTYVLANDPGDMNRVDFELLPSSGPNVSEIWAPAGSNPYTYKNVDTGRFLRVSNKGLGKYFPVVAGANATKWNESQLP